jgi:hypothetical protein
MNKNSNSETCNTPIKQETPEKSDTPSSLSPESQRMLDTMDSTFDDPDFLEKLKQGRKKNQND